MPAPTHAALAAVLLLLATAVHAQPKVLEGTARVTDGDTLWVAGRDKVRLYGIDAPESKQQCSDAKGVQYACGAASTKALKDKIGTKPLTCTVKDIDQYGRNVAVCSIKECSGKQASSCKTEDLNAFMVQEGHAVAYRGITKQYAGQEDRAKIQKKGVWQGKFTQPSQWRKQNKAAEQDAGGAPRGQPPRAAQQARPGLQPTRPQQQQQQQALRPDQPATSSTGAGTGSKPSYAAVLG